MTKAAEALRNGINGQAYLLFDTGMLPPVRFNLGYQRFEFDETVLGGPIGESTVLSGVAGLSICLLRLGPLQPYITAGLGAFNIADRIEEGEDASQVRFGIDGGGGLTLGIGRLEAFIEGPRPERQCGDRCHRHTDGHVDPNHLRHPLLSLLNPIGTGSSGCCPSPPA